MFSEQALPLIEKRFPRTEAFVCRTLKTNGLGESIVEEKIAGPLRALTDAGMELGYCAHIGEVDVRFFARGARAAQTVAEAERIVLEQLREAVYGVDEETLEEIVVRLLTERGQTLVVAESFLHFAVPEDFDFGIFFGSVD